MDFDRINKLASFFVSAANPTTSSQAADVEAALSSAGLWNLSDQVASLLNIVKVPEDCKITIGLAVDKLYNISYIVVLNPQHPSAKVLSLELKKKFGDAMKKALISTKLHITDTITLKWLSF